MLPTRLSVALVRLGTTNLNVERRAIECYEQGETRPYMCCVCFIKPLYQSGVFKLYFYLQHLNSIQFLSKYKHSLIITTHPSDQNNFFLMKSILQKRKYGKVQPNSGWKKMSIAGSLPFTLLAVAFTHPITLFATLSLAKSQDINPLLLLMPLSAVQFLVTVIQIIRKSLWNQKKQVFFTSKAQFLNLQVRHMLLLGFVYSFGYIIPTVRAIQASDTKFILQFAVVTLPLDLLFTLLLSRTLMKRNFFTARPWREFVLPIVLPFLAICFSSLIYFWDADIGFYVTANPFIIIQSEKQEFVWIPLSRFCYCFTVVAVQYYQVKDCAYQKAIVSVSDQVNRIRHDKELMNWIKQSGIQPEQEAVPAMSEMRETKKNSGICRKTDQVFKFYSFLAQTVNRLDKLIADGTLKLRKEHEWITTTTWEGIKSLEEVLEFVTMLEQVIGEHPEMEWDLNEIWRTNKMIHKDKIHKPWTRSYAYTKFKINQWLVADLADAETHAHIFRSRDEYYREADFRGTKSHSKQNKRDILYDNHAAGDYFQFGKSMSQSFSLSNFFDGLCTYPALIITLKLTNHVENGIQTYLNPKFLTFTDNQLTVLIIFGILGFMQIFRGLAIHNLLFRHMHIYRGETNQVNAVMYLIGIPIVMSLVLYSVYSGSSEIKVPLTYLISVVFSISGYLLVVQSEHVYRFAQHQQRMIDTLWPMESNQNLSKADKKLLDRFNFDQENLQFSFMSNVLENSGIVELARLIGDCKLLGNVRPLLLPVLPQVDLRHHCDEMHFIRSAEWNDYFPNSMRNGRYDYVSKEYSEMSNQIFKQKDKLMQQAEIDSIRDREAYLLGSGFDNLVEAKKMFEKVANAPKETKPTLMTEKQWAENHQWKIDRENADIERRANNQNQQQSSSFNNDINVSSEQFLPPAPVAYSLPAYQDPSRITDEEMANGRLSHAQIFSQMERDDVSEASRF